MPTAARGALAGSSAPKRTAGLARVIRLPTLAGCLPEGSGVELEELELLRNVAAAILRDHVVDDLLPSSESVHPSDDRLSVDRWRFVDDRPLAPVHRLDDYRDR